ncbi:hypothetical protein NBRC116188_28220 [Oceaniserpentilla sp. 4NH20-0058]|uniref:FMN-binding protein n=1 Tax=Oceaniserpentilla sp. 4NH20-0058 TaxID=3127660 RepID=UPI003101C479
MLKFIYLYLAICLLASNGVAQASSAQFLQQHQFNSSEAKSLWLNKTQQAAIHEILSHPYAGVRIRYWQNTQKAGFVLNEIGKELPITYGIVVDSQGIKAFEVLAFRESRGDEIKNLGFRKQFFGGKLTNDGELNQNIDGISGATYSVRSMTKIAKLALYLHQQISQP